MRAMSMGRMICLLVLILPGLGWAQSSTDWDIRTNPETKLTVAFTSYDSGLSIAVRCSNGGLEALIAGLPPVTTDLRTIGIGFADGPLSSQRWVVASRNTTAVTTRPSEFARSLRNGGRLQIRVTEDGEQGRALRYVVELPPSNTAIDQTLVACDRPLIDPRDAEVAALGEDGLPSILSWVRRPEVSYPTGRTYEKGFATVSCLTAPDGRLRDCEIDSEYPGDGGFGAAAMRAARGGLVTNRLNPDAPIPVSKVVFTARFGIYEDPEAPTGSRIPRAENR